MDRLKTLPEYNVFPMLGVYYMGFNVETAKPLDNVDVRKALALGHRPAVDRRQRDQGRSDPGHWVSSPRACPASM